MQVICILHLEILWTRHSLITFWEYGGFWDCFSMSVQAPPKTTVTPMRRKVWESFPWSQPGYIGRINRYQGKKRFEEGKSRPFLIRSMCLSLAQWVPREWQCFSHSVSWRRGQGAAGDWYSVARALAELNERKCGNSKPC